MKFEAFYKRLGITALLAGHLTVSAGEFDFFESKIRPVLSKHCYQCHSAGAAEKGKIKASLLLDSREGIRNGGDTGAAVVPGQVEDSLLLSALKQQKFQMPPKGKLPDEVINDFVTWVESGAPDPREGKAVIATVNSTDAANHWAFSKPLKPEAPVVRNAAWPQSDIDLFVLAQMEGRKLEPVAPASNLALVRRIYFDLIGLPPTPGQVDAFHKAAEKDRQAAVANLTDQLLQSKHYGERWGRHWLDVARYAEDQAHTFGVKPRANAHQYRDWVIQMFNEDLPFDQFIKLQLAGDLMDKEPEDRFKQYAGLGFLGLGAQYYKNSDREKAEADELDDTIDTVTRGFLGLTVACSRCHDHKYDPIPTEDYYALAGVFSGRRYGTIPLVDREIRLAYEKEQEEIKHLENHWKDYLRTIGMEDAREKLTDLSRHLQEGWKMAVLNANRIKYSEEEYTQAANINLYYARRLRDLLSERKKGDLSKRFPELDGWHEVPQKTDAEISLEDLEVPDSIIELSDQFQEEVMEAVVAFDCTGHEHAEELQSQKTNTDRWKRQVGKMDKDRQRLLNNILFSGGAPFYANENDVVKFFADDGQKAEADKLKTLLEDRRMEATPKYAEAHTIQGGGRALQVHIRGNPANKGDWVARGTLAMLAKEPRPTEPAEAKKHAYTRLDLASAIATVDNPLTARVIVNRVWQWHFGRGLVGSSSNFGLLGDKPTHPELLDWLTTGFIENNWSIKWLHRQILNTATYQLSSESHAANEEIDGGNQFRWRFDRRRLEVEAWRDALLAVSGQLDPEMGGPTLQMNDNNKRRTVYAKISRHQLNGMLRLFDFPDANVSAAKRTNTTVPQQQLFVLNSNFFVNQAKAFAKRVITDFEDATQRVEAAYSIAFGRKPTEAEAQLAQAFLGVEKDNQDKLSRWEQYCQALLASNELMYID